MVKRYADILIEFKERRGKLSSKDPSYYSLLQASREDFFNDIEAVAYKKSIAYIKEFNFDFLIRIDNDHIYFSDKNILVFSCLMTLVIDKYGIDAVIKDLLPETIQRAEKTNLLNYLLSWFVSLFHKAEINIKEGSELNQALAEAVVDLRDLQDKQGLFLERGADFGYALSVLRDRIFMKYAKSLSLHDTNLKRMLVNKRHIEGTMNPSVSDNTRRLSRGDEESIDGDSLCDSSFDDVNSLSSGTEAPIYENGFWGSNGNLPTRRHSCGNFFGLPNLAGEGERDNFQAQTSRPASCAY